MPRCIFEEISLTLGNSYLICFLIIGILIVLNIYAMLNKKYWKYLKRYNNDLLKTKEYKRSQSFIHYCLTYLNVIIKKSRDNVFNIVTKKIPNFQYFIADLIQFYIKLPIKFLWCIEYLPRFIFISCFITDVFLFKKFYYYYKAIYLIILTLISKLIRYSAKTHNYMLLDLADDLLEFYVDTNGFYKYHIKPNNEGLKDIQHYWRMRKLLYAELDIIESLEKSLEMPYINLYRLFIHLIYFISWGYIIYFYPIPIIHIHILKH